MRHLAQPRVLLRAIAASLLTTAACFPRLELWPNRPCPAGYLAAVVFFCCIFLWGFVFAWHTQYSGRPVLMLKPDRRWFAAATVAALLVALTLHQFLDPALRAKIPGDYPADLKQWLGLTLFAVAFYPLFFIFAPFAWCLRLFKSQRVATVLTVLFGAFVLTTKAHSTPAPVSNAVFAMLLAGRVAAGFLAVWLYLRGGMLLIWWWTLLIESRNLLSLADNS
ncbi:MAG TPA: hypothetical protein VMB80_06775 [Candidatus Acidoferrum sp.]|nr:hypothetical protein [Candidatus Acidoferrum sp.]